MPDSPSIELSIVVPVRDEDPKTVEHIVHQTNTIFRGLVELHIVDDGSKVPCPLASLRHPVSFGYGAAIKAGIRASNSQWIATMDGDGQHRVRDIKRLIDFLEEFPDLDMVIGDRRLKEHTFKRWIGRKILNWTATLFANRWIPDLNSGLRIFKKELALSYESILSDRFSYTTTLTMSLLADRRKVDWLPIKLNSRQNGSTKVRLWRDGIFTLYQIIRIGGALRTRSIRNFLRKFPIWFWIQGRKYERRQT